MMRRASGYLEAGEEEIETLRALKNEIRGIGTSMNQTARVANRARHADVGGLRAETKELGPTPMRLSLQLRTILDTSQRRWDGRERLARDVAAFDREDPSETGKHGAVARPRTDATGSRKGTGAANAEPAQRANALSTPQTAGEDKPRRRRLRPMRPFVHPNKQR